MPFTVPHAQNPELSIVVLFTHDPELATRCIASIEAVSDELPPSEAIFLLGGSPEAVREVVRGADGAQVIDSPQNLGTSVGWQLGFNAARGRHVLLLHEDATATPGMVPSLIEALDSDPAAAIVGPWLAECGGDEPSNCGWVWFRDQAQTRISPEHVPPELADAPYAVDGVSSAISLWDRKAWLEGGGFDERNFPAMGVDADACTSAWARGRTVLVDPRVTGIHRGGAMDDAPGRLSGMFVRYFMLDRYKRLWFEKWSALAEQYPVLPPGSDPGTLETPSLLKIQQRRELRPLLPGEFPAAEHPFTDPERSGAAPTEVSPDLLARIGAAEAAAMDEYHLWLIDNSEEQHEEIVRLRDAAATLNAILNGRWWRLRSRLLRLTRRS